MRSFYKEKLSDSLVDEFLPYFCSLNFRSCGSEEIPFIKSVFNAFSKNSSEIIFYANNNNMILRPN